MKEERMGEKLCFSRKEIEKYLKNFFSNKVDTEFSWVSGAAKGISVLYARKDLSVTHHDDTIVGKKWTSPDHPFLRVIMFPDEGYLQLEQSLPCGGYDFISLGEIENFSFPWRNGIEVAFYRKNGDEIIVRPGSGRYRIHSAGVFIKKEVPK